MFKFFYVLSGPTAPPIESAGFMNALSSASIPKVRKRMKSQPPLVHKSVSEVIACISSNTVFREVARFNWLVERIGDKT